MTVDVPMYLARWRADVADGSRLLRPLEGLHDVSTRWVVTHDIAHWKDEIAWMSLYFSAAVWASLALCVFYSLRRLSAAIPHRRRRDQRAGADAADADGDSGRRALTRRPTRLFLRFPLSRGCEILLGHSLHEATSRAENKHE